MELATLMEALGYGTSVPLKHSAFSSRRLFAEARDAKRWTAVAAHPDNQRLVDELREEGARFLAEPIRPLPYSLFKLFWETGSRQEYEREYFERRARLNGMAILLLMDGDLKYAAALEDIIWAICDEYTWCLPAHLDENQFAALVDEPQETLYVSLDLFSAETGFALAEILSLLEDKIAPFVVARGRNEVLRRVLKPYQVLAKPLWWETAKMNWAAVCAGSIGAAAMYLMEDVAVLAPVLARVLETMDCFLDGFGTDGACREGLSYWTYGFGYFTYFAALLKERTTGRVNLFNQDQVKQIALFQQKCYLGENQVVAFSDTSLTQNYQSGLTHYLQSVFPEVQILDCRYRAMLRDDSCHRWAHAVRDFIWYDSRNGSDLDLAGTYYFPEAQWLIAKANRNGSAVCFAVKGGHNDEPHNHNDVGSFIFHAKGDNLLTELGRGIYTRQYFGSERYQFLCAGSQGHSVPVIEGQHQKQGPEYGAQGVHYETNDNADIMVMDIAKAYGNTNLKKLIRRLAFRKTDAPGFVLHDLYEFEQVPAAVSERLVSFFEPRVTFPNRIGIQGCKGCMEINYDENRLRPRFSHEPFVTHEAVEMIVYIIDFDVIALSKNFETELEFRLISL